MTNNNEILRTGYEWMQYYIDNTNADAMFNTWGSIVVSDPDGFGDRKKGIPALADKMTEEQYQIALGGSSIRPYKPERHDPWLNEMIHGIEPEPMTDAERIRLNEEISRLGAELRKLDEERRNDI